MQSRKKLISIVIPAYNEEAVLDELKKRLQKVMAANSNYDFEVIIVENGSHDSSFEKLVAINKEDPRFKVIQFSRNFGIEGGTTAGLRRAKGDAAVIMNADLQDTPELITQFIERWEEGYEIVYAIIKRRRGVPLGRRILSSLFYKITYVLTNKAIPENVSDFRLIDKKVYSAVNQMDERNRFTRGLTIWTGFKQTGIPYERAPRYAGEKKATFFEIFKTAIDGIVSFSYFPLSVSALIGLLVSIGSFILMFIEFGLYWKYGRVVHGFTTLMTVITFLFGMLFFLLGIVGVYVARIYDEIKKRPHFIVKDEIGFN